MSDLVTEGSCKKSPTNRMLTPPKAQSGFDLIFVSCSCKDNKSEESSMLTSSTIRYRRFLYKPTIRAVTVVLFLLKFFSLCIPTAL